MVLTVSAVSGSRAAEVAHEIGDAERDDGEVQDRRVLEPFAGRASAGGAGGSAIARVAESDAEGRASRAALRRRRGQPHDERDHDDLDGDRDEALPQEDGVARSR